MNLLQSMRRLFSRKDSATRQLIAFNSVGRAVGTPRRFDKFAEEGYVKNVVAYGCIDMISQACASIPWLLYRKPKSKGAKKEEITDHPFLDLMAKPNPYLSESEFRTAVIAFKLIAGNSYVQAVGPNPNQINELHTLRPDRVTVIPGSNGYPAAYDYTVGGRSVRLPVDVVSGRASVLHLRNFHPLHDWYGLANIEPAAMAVDQHNEAGIWNLSLLMKSATPSGVLVAEASTLNPSGSITEEQRLRLKEEIDSFFSGARNAGRPLLLEGGLKWNPTGLSPKDMDWSGGKDKAAREIALGFGVPPMLLGIPGDNTYSNYKEARMAFFEQTVIHHMKHLTAWWNLWLLPSMDPSPGLVADFDVDAIDALAPKRAEIWDQTQKADFLTPNEKRERLGFSPKPGGDELLVSSSMVPLSYAIQDPMPTEQPTGGNPDQNPEDPNAPDAEDPTEEMSPTEETDTGGKSLRAPAGKVFNLKSKRAKAQEWRESNRIRMKFEKRLARQLSALFRVEGQDVAEAASKATNIAEALDKAQYAVTANKLKFKSALKASLLTVGHEFGDRVLRDLKSVAGAIETKDSSIRFRSLFTEWVDRNVGKRIDDISETTKKKLKRAVEDFQESGEPLDQLSDEIEGLYEGFAGGRAEVIARTEVHAASNAASTEAAKATGIPNLRKEWIFTEDKRTRPEHRLSQDDSVVGIDEKFDVAGEALDAPGDPDGSPGNIINCRCSVAFLSEGEE